MGACLSQPPAAASATSSVDAQSTVGPRTPNEIARFYGIPTTSDGGAGQHIAVIALDAEPPLDLAELKRDFEFLGMTEMPMVSLVDVGDNVSSDGGSDAQGTRSGETHLDVEVIGALCPAAQITVYRGHSNVCQRSNPLCARAHGLGGVNTTAASWLTLTPRRLDSHVASR